MDLIAGLQTAALLLLAAVAPGVVLSREPRGQAVAVSFMGLVLALVFFLFEAPDVALSQLVVGAVALPMMILLALAKVRRHETERTFPPEGS